jgi:tRNA pseudouridine38-40 synthase
VHARAQVLHGDVPEQALVVLPTLDRARESVLAAALSDALPASITVHAVRRVPATFDARFSATARAYRFRLRDGVDPRAQGRDGGPDASGIAPDVWGITDLLDVPAMRRASRALVGEHDFAAFCRRAPGRTTVRRIDLLSLRRIGAAPGRIDVRLRGARLLPPAGPIDRRLPRRRRPRAARGALDRRPARLPGTDPSPRRSRRPTA